jgi:leader peptidase (prepilin peptidase)/N-methyltransferase
LLFVGIGLKIGLEETLLPALALTVTLVAAAETDLEHRIIPNRLMATSAVAAVALWAIVDPGRLPENLIAGAGAGGFLLAAAVAYPAGMGMGDVKLAGVIGVVLGALGLRYVGVAAGTAIVLGGVGGLVALLLGRSRKDAIPFGPYMAAGAMVAVFLGDRLAAWYLDLYR